MVSSLDVIFKFIDDTIISFYLLIIGFSANSVIIDYYAEYTKKA